MINSKQFQQNICSARHSKHTRPQNCNNVVFTWIKSDHMWQRYGQKRFRHFWRLHVDLWLCTLQQGNKQTVVEHLAMELRPTDSFGTSVSLTWTRTVQPSKCNGVIQGLSKNILFFTWRNQTIYGRIMAKKFLHFCVLDCDLTFQSPKCNEAIMGPLWNIWWWSYDKKRFLHFHIVDLDLWSFNIQMPRGDRETVEGHLAFIWTKSNQLWWRYWQKRFCHFRIFDLDLYVAGRQGIVKEYFVSFLEVNQICSKKHRHFCILA